MLSFFRSCYVVAVVAVLGIFTHQAQGLILKPELGTGANPKTSRLARYNWGIESSSFLTTEKSSGRKVIVAIIDTGIDADHPEFRNRLWKKDGSQSEYGFDFANNKKNPGDQNGHGTHIAGIVAATAENASIMALRYYVDENHEPENLRNTVKAIDYAVANGAKIINYSAAGLGFNEDEERAIKRAEAKGVLFITAAGNASQNIDSTDKAFYPAGYGLANILSVAAIDMRERILASSNWGKAHVHVAAPGEKIFSTLPKGAYGYLTGTSQATAFVTGLAARILERNPEMSPTEVKDLIIASAKKVKGLETKVSSAGRINAEAAMKLAANGTVLAAGATMAGQRSPANLVSEVNTVLNAIMSTRRALSR